jgi:hypothetical protein
MIMEAAASLAPDRAVVLRASPGIGARFVQFGAGDLPQIRMIAEDDG